MQNGNVKQQQLLQLVAEKRNMFITGPAGTGKSALVKNIVQVLEDRGSRVAITASTGIAACNIGGTTLHRFIGCGLAIGSPRKLAASIRSRDHLLEKWLAVDTLIIDEISMIGAKLFDRVEETARLVRQSDEPFGGIQIIAVGDFLQLPPVRDRRCFLASSWPSVIESVAHLDKIFRQKHPEFVAVLCKMRVADVGKDEIRWIRSNLERPLPLPIDVIPTWTVCKNKEADRINRAFLRKLDGPSTAFTAHDTMSEGITPEDIDRECSMKRKLLLRIGAKVMLTYNYSDTLVNGSIGIVISFSDGLPVVKFVSGGIMCVALRTWNMYICDNSLQNRTETTDAVRVKNLSASRTQLPLILAWSITIHKSQGQTLDWQVAVVANVFETGQLYTALSRASDPGRLQVVGYDPKQNFVCQETLNYYTNSYTTLE